MKKHKLNVKVEVWNIVVEETDHYDNGFGSGYFTFDYCYQIDKKKKKFGQYDGSWSSQSRNEFLRVLRSGAAVKEVMQMIF